MGIFKLTDPQTTGAVWLGRLSVSRRAWSVCVCTEGPSYAFIGLDRTDNKRLAMLNA